MRLSSLSTIVVAALLAFGASGAAQSAPVKNASNPEAKVKQPVRSKSANDSAPPEATYCSDATSPHTAGLRTDQVTFSGKSSLVADDCYGIVRGNDGDNGQNVGLNELELSWGDGWRFLVKDDNGEGAAGRFAGIDFVLGVDALGARAGSWTLTASPAELLPISLDFVVVLKASNEFALWFFDDAIVGGGEGGTWSSVFTNNERTQGLSHLSLYVRAGDGQPPRPTPTPTPPQGAVPEPSALALVGLALVGLAAARRRRRD